MSSSNFQVQLDARLLRAAIRRELADAQAALAHAEDHDPEAVAEAQRVVAEALQRLRDLSNPRSDQLCLRYLDRPRAALRSVESRHVTEAEREQLRSDLHRILNKEHPNESPMPIASPAHSTVTASAGADQSARASRLRCSHGA
jgi:hypothetical protein